MKRKKIQNMNKEERELTNHLTALRGELEPMVNGFAVRRVSMESLGVLQMIGSPYAAAFGAALAGQTPERVTPGPVDSVLLAWVHAEDADRVLEVALDCAPGLAEPAVAAALRFIRGWKVEDVAAVIRYAMGDLAGVEAASYDMAAPELGRGGKKKS